jgi:hypothetical protein
MHVDSAKNDRKKLFVGSLVPAVVPSQQGPNWPPIYTNAHEVGKNGRLTSKKFYLRKIYIPPGPIVIRPAPGREAAYPTWPPVSPPSLAHFCVSQPLYGRDLCRSGGTGKADTAKLPGAGIWPEAVPREMSGRKRRNSEGGSCSVDGAFHACGDAGQCGFKIFFVSACVCKRC